MGSGESEPTHQSSVEAEQAHAQLGGTNPAPQPSGEAELALQPSGDADPTPLGVE